MDAQITITLYSSQEIKAIQLQLIGDDLRRQNDFGQN